MKGYHQTDARDSYCDRCGEWTSCDVLEADSRELDTGYLDYLVMCPDCRKELEA